MYCDNVVVETCIRGTHCGTYGFVCNLCKSLVKYCQGTAKMGISLNHWGSLCEDAEDAELLKLTKKIFVSMTNVI